MTPQKSRPKREPTVFPMAPDHHVTLALVSSWSSLGSSIKPDKSASTFAMVNSAIFPANSGSTNEKRISSKTKTNSEETQAAIHAIRNAPLKDNPPSRFRSPTQAMHMPAITNTIDPIATVVLMYAATPSR